MLFKPFEQLVQRVFLLYLGMKKGTKIALIITLVYCSLATYELHSMSLIFKSSRHSVFPEWLEAIFIPGWFLGFIGTHTFGTTFLILGPLFTFIILFYVLKTILNWMIVELQKRKN